MGIRKKLIGIVISNKMKKTIIVRVLRMSKHPKYGRIMRQYNKFKAHDEKNAASIGDSVLIEETRPLSKDKHFRLVRIVQRSRLPHVEIKEEPNDSAA